MRRATVLALVTTVGLGTACASLREPRETGATAAAYAAAGRHDEAVREIEIAVRAEPRRVDLRRQAATIHAGAGNDEMAVGHLEIAIQLAPTDGENWIQLGELETDRRNVADAYVAFRRAAEIAPGDIRAVAGLALSAESLGFQSEANDAYARWAELERKQDLRIQAGESPKD